MEKGINLITEEFKNQLYELVNNCGLPISSAYYILKDFMREFTGFYEETINNELKQYQEKEAKKEEEKEESSEETKEEE